MRPTEIPYPQFFDLDGSPLDGGSIYFGLPNQNPETSPITVYWDSAGTQPASQPIQTLNGYTVRAGTPARVYVNAEYSVTARNKFGQLVYSAQNSADYDPSSFARDLATADNAKGAALVAFLQSGTNATARTVQDKLQDRVSVFDFMTPTQIADVKANTASVDVTSAVNAAITYLVSVNGGELFFPRGTYLLNGSVGADTYKNGILLPDTNGDFATRKGICLVGEGPDTVLKAGSANMIIVRSSRLYSGVESLKIDGAGLSNVIGAALAPESLTQTTELVSQSYQNWRRVFIENCTEGMLFQPGPRVGGGDSGAFYHKVDNCVFNQNTRHVWMKKDVTATGNRTTRTAFHHCIFTRGNTGVQIDGGTEIDFINPYFEAINTGTSPSATPTAFKYNDTNPSLINLFGGYAEACTKAIVAVSGSEPWMSLLGFQHNSSPDTSQAFMSTHVQNRLRLSKVGNQAAYLEFGDNSFVNFTADPDQVGQKTLSLFLNSAQKERWDATGSKTFYGTAGNITYTADGAGISFSRAGVNTITAAGAGATLGYNCDFHLWSSAAGAALVSLSSSQFIPRADNAISSGASGFRWSSIWSATGTIQTSDPRTKTDIADSPLGLDFINRLRPVAYRFKVGGNKIVGAREISPAVIDEDGREVEPAKVEPIIETMPGKRLHYGFLTTEVKAVLDKCGVSDFAGYVKADINDPESEEGLRYEQFIAPLVKAVQELTARVQELEAKLPAA